MDIFNPSKLPKNPGIYLFKDHQNQIIYIGKAKSLRDRVATYFQRRNTDWKIENLIMEHATVDFIITKNEMEALLLEASLIKEHKPKYNVLLKSGQPFLYILISKDQLPLLKLVRNKKEKGTYFGPFLHKGHARSAYNYLMSTFKLVLCNKKIEHGCLDYHIGICAGSCMPTFNKQDYLKRLELAQQALERNHRQFLTMLKSNIAEYTKILAYEKAQRMHEYLQNFDVIFNTLQTRFSLAKFEDSLVKLAAPKKFVSTFAKEGNTALQELLHLTKPIRSIDCFDISHFQSSSLVGSCVRFTNGVPDKDKYRRFKIKSLTEQNDYAALQEIVSRRYKDETEKPDLILIDGGKGQRNAILPLVGDTPCISLAKREERIYCDQFPEGLKLDPHSSIGQLLIALRDYAHHAAVTYHRVRRRKDFEQETEKKKR